MTHKLPAPASVPALRGSRSTRAGAAALALAGIAALGLAGPATSLGRVDASRAHGRRLVVVTTGYALRGSTATGLPVRRGVAAVDPALIPLGSHFTVPGYGEAVAADTGPGIRGNRIDLWFATRKQAYAWGTRKLTITLR